MGYVLPIPQYQYNDYKERVIQGTKSRYAYVDAVQPVALDAQASRSEMDESREERLAKRRREQEAFHVHLAKISGKGVQLDELA